MIVSNASFLVMVLADDGAAGTQARERLRGEELAAPHLVDVEVTSVLRRSVLTGNVTEQRAGQALADLADAPLLTYDAKLAAAPGARCVFEVFGK